MKGVGAFVERMRGDRCHGADLVRIGRLDGERVAIEGGQQPVRAMPRIGGGAAAFQQLAHVHGEAAVEAAQQRVGAHHRRIEGAAGDDDLGAGLDRPHEGLVAHLADDPRRPLEMARRQGVVVIERRDGAIGQPAAQPVAVDLGADPRRAEAVAALAADLAIDLDQPVKMAVAAGAAGAADQDRDAMPMGGIEDHLQVLPHRPAVGEGDAGAEIVRAGVDRSGVDGEDVGPTFHAEAHRPLGNAVAQHSLRREDGEAVGGHYHAIRCCMRGTCCCAP